MPSSYLYIGIVSGLLPLDFPNKILYTSHLMHATCLAHLILLELTTLICGKENKL